MTQCVHNEEFLSWRNFIGQKNAHDSNQRSHNYKPMVFQSEPTATIQDDPSTEVEDESVFPDLKTNA